MDALLTELTDGLPDAAQAARILVRLTAAALLGAVIGIQRERAGKPSPPGSVSSAPAPFSS